MAIHIELGDGEIQFNIWSSDEDKCAYNTYKSIPLIKGNYNVVVLCVL